MLNHQDKSRKLFLFTIFAGLLFLEMSGCLTSSDEEVDPNEFLYGYIYGIVSDGDSKERLAEVKVILSGGLIKDTMVGYTNDTGYYIIRNIPVGYARDNPVHYLEMTASKTGYTPYCDTLQYYWKSRNWGWNIYMYSE